MDDIFDIVEDETLSFDDTNTNKNSDHVDDIKDEVSNKKKTVLEMYGENLTKRVYVTNPAIAREDEIEKTILTILTPDKSAILVGKAGIGKTAIVEGIAYKIQNGDVPNAIKGYNIIKINTSSLLGKYVDDDGTEELRINILLKEVERAEKTILFIDEIQIGRASCRE